MKRLFACAAFVALIVSTAEGGNVATVDINNFAVDDSGNPTQFVLSVKAPTDMSPVLYAGYGMSDGGSDTNAWDNFEFIRPNAIGSDGTITVDAPSGYGSTWLHIRYFLVTGVAVLDSVRGDGAAYIDTGRKGRTGDAYEIEFRRSGEGLIFGSRYAAAQDNVTLLAGRDNTLYKVTLDYANYSQSRLEVISSEKTQWFYAKLSATSRELYYILDGVRQYPSEFTTTSAKSNPDLRTVTDEFETRENLHLFNVSVGQGLDPAKFTGEIRRYVVTTDGGTVTNQHLVAARNEQGVVGFYDCVNRDFYGPADGGTFEAGDVTGEVIGLRVIATSPRSFPDSFHVCVEFQEAAVSTDPIYSPVLSYSFESDDEGVPAADIWLVWGADGVLSHTNLVSATVPSGTVVENYTCEAITLTPHCHLSCRIVASVNGEIVSSSLSKEVSTLDLEPRQIMAAIPRRRGGAVTVNLKLTPSEEQSLYLIVAYGKKDAGDAIEDWDHVEWGNELIPPEVCDHTWTLPGNVADAKQARFFLSTQACGIIDVYDGLKGDGTAYIDTRRKGRTGEAYEIEFRRSGDGLVFGSRYAADKDNVTLNAHQTSGKNRYTLDYANYKQSRLDVYSSETAQWFYAKISATSRELYYILDGVRQYPSEFASATATANPDPRQVTDGFETHDNLHLFNVSVGQGLDPAKFTGEIRRYVVTTDGGTVTNQHLVAARARDESRIGMYDLVNGEWFENVADRGAFTTTGDKTDEYDAFVGKSFGVSLTPSGFVLLLK